MRVYAVVLCAALLPTGPVWAQNREALHREIDQLAAQVQPKVLEYRRYLHQHPELSNREFETAKYVASHLRALGLEVQTGVANTGVVAVLKGGQPGPVVALRADMDALPVTEDTGLPFASTVRAKFDGKDVGVMHACGHDTHTSMLLGVAEVLVQLRARLPGTVKFVFQPAEEGAPDGEHGGAELMLKEGVFRQAPVPEVVFGAHTMSGWDAGTIAYRPGGAMASADDLKITVTGRQTHGALPWQGVDPIVISSQIIMGLQTITARQMNIAKAPVVVTIGKIEGGVRNNIIPDSVTLKGTLRALDPAMRSDLQARVRRTATAIAESAGGSATVDIGTDTAYPVTVNNPQLTQRMLPTLERVAGPGKVVVADPMLGAEDFSYFAQTVPGLFIFLGGRPVGQAAELTAANHSPKFLVDESMLVLGVRTLANLVVDYSAP